MKTILLAGALLLATLAFLPAADAKPLDDPQCMPVYSRTDVGQLSIVRRDSCHAETYWCPYEGAPVAQCETLLR